jgi:hypothetical protein
MMVVRKDIAMIRKRTLIRMPPELVAEIDRLIGPRKRSAFLVELATREIRRRKVLKALETTEPIWRDEDHPELGDDSDAWVRSMRARSE